MSIYQTLLRLCLLPLLVSFAGPALARDDIATANSHLKRAESNLTLVDGAIGQRTSPPKGSAAKLAKVRLDQAAGDIKAAGTLLSPLKSGAGLAEAVKRYNAALETHTRLAGILTGTPPAPQPKPEKGTEKKQTEKKPTPEAKPAESATVKLGYPHADNFKNSLFTLRRVEADAAGITQLHAELLPTADQLTIDHRKTAGALSTIAETRRQAGFVNDGLKKIPANGEGVAEAKVRLAAVTETLDGAEAYFKPLHERLMQMINPANFPEFETDVKRLTELAGQYANHELMFREQRAKAAEAFAQAEAAKAECVRIAQKYTRLMEQRTDQGVRLENAGNGFLRRHQEFLAAADQQKSTLPASIREDLAKADGMANEAVQNQKPLWFTGGIPQTLGWADDKLMLLEALDPQGGAALKAEADALKTSLRERADSLKALIIRENRPPEDRYAGPDRDVVIGVAKDAWSKQEADFEVLSVRIPSEAWSRETKWVYSNGTWYFVDQSRLQVRLIVADKQNPEQAIDRPVTVRKDHQKGDTLIGLPMRSFDEALEPGEYFLRANVK